MQFGACRSSFVFLFRKSFDVRAGPLFHGISQIHTRAIQSSLLPQVTELNFACIVLFIRKRDRSIMDNKKKQDLVQRCIQWTKQAEDVICCPVCYETKDNVVMCSVGHHVCVACQSKLNNNSCPTCKSRFTGTKSFLIKELTAMLGNLELSLNDLNKVMQISDNKSDYRTFIKTLLTNLSAFLNKTSSSITCFSKYLENPKVSEKTDLVKQFQSLTDQLNDLKLYMDNVRVNLILLKK
ncbi:hypothetical protein TSAR_001281 [Trichomalopsis sarcophagae]|uniref:RING-type domain-containing protein n=1 Tax=Trichomalopsis sarcophagae TaxID=543379 RepID=A0A232ERC1_9HYME|nr:hypothetical protein TSAR_001281 [Trichomalopsis sarcophagae]